MAVQEKKNGTADHQSYRSSFNDGSDHIFNIDLMKGSSFDEGDQDPEYLMSNNDDEEEELSSSSLSGSSSSGLSSGMGRLETQKLKRIRLFFSLLMISTAALFSTTLWMAIRKSEQKALERHFVDRATKIIDSFHQAVKQKVGALEGLSFATTSYSLVAATKASSFANDTFSVHTSFSSLLAAPWFLDCPFEAFRSTSRSISVRILPLIVVLLPFTFGLDGILESSSSCLFPFC